MDDFLSPKILGSAYLSPRTESNCVERRTRALEQIALTASGLNTATATLFLWKRDVLKEKSARLLVETALTALGLRIALAALFLSKKKCKSFLNHSLFF